jgi:hypothetical protein
MFTIGASQQGGQIDTVFVDNFKANRTTQKIPPGWKFISNINGTREGGTTQSSGPRLFYFATTGNFGEGFYFRSTAANDTGRVVYGLYPDYRLHLKAGKHQISFYYVGWKQAESCTFSLADTLGNVVYTATASSPNNLGVSQGTSVVVTNATLHEWTFIVPSETDYVMSWKCVGNWREMLLGNIKIISIPSTASLYKNMLNSALNIAQSAKLVADSSLYDGNEKTALLSAIQKYTGVSYTAPSAYKAASAELTNAASALLAHKANVDTYFSYLGTANTRLAANANTKYARLSAYPKLQTAINQYGAINVQDDALVKVANDTINYYSSLLQNLITNGVPALTYRLNKAIALAQTLRVDTLYADLIKTAQEALTDDDNLVNTLNEKNKQFLHHNLALNLIQFGNSWEDSTKIDSLELTSYIKNPNFYTMQTTAKLDNTTFPGWVTSGLSGAGPSTLATAINPVVDTYVSVYNVAIDYFQQTITGLPAGVYNLHMKTRTGDPTANGKTLDDIKGKYYYYVVQGTDTIKTDFMITAFGLPSTPTVIKNVKIVDGTVTMGVHTGTVSGYTPSLFWGDPALYMVGKAEGYPYTGIKAGSAVNPSVKEIQYYSIEGYRINHPVKGITIVKKIFENGAVEVNKIWMK